MSLRQRRLSCKAIEGRIKTKWQAGWKRGGQEGSAGGSVTRDRTGGQTQAAGVGAASRPAEVLSCPAATLRGAVSSVPGERQGW